MPVRPWRAKLNANVIWIWLLMVVAKYQPNLDPRYRDAVNRAYDQSYAQSGMERQVNQIQSYVEGKGLQAVRNTGVSEVYLGTPVYLYRVYCTKQVTSPRLKLPAGITLEARAAQTSASLGLAWHF